MRRVGGVGSATKLGLQDDYYFQHDNDSKHTTRIVKEWFLNNVPHVLATPPQLQTSVFVVSCILKSLQ